MPDDTPHHLESLTVSKLKTVAEEYGVDISSCKHKKDYVTALMEKGITEQQAKLALMKVEQSAKEGEKDTRALEEIEQEIEEIADRPTEPREMPKDQARETEKNIDRALLTRPSFFEIDSELERAWNKMIMGDYREAMGINAEARSKMFDRFSSFQIYSSALAIRAAETIIDSLARAQGKLDSRLKTALAEAKKAYIEGSPRRREETLEDLEAITIKSYEAFFEGGAANEEELHALLSDYESFGSQTQHPRRLLEIAAQARQAFNIVEYSSLLTQAKQAAKNAREERVEDINRALSIAKAAVEEAKELGASPSRGFKDLVEARKAFDKEAFRQAIELTAAIEKAADEAHLEKLKDHDVRAKQMARVQETIMSLERTLQEAASYGMEVEEGLLFIGKARNAMEGRDLVNAAKLARHVRSKSSSIEEDIDSKRIEAGVLKKVEDAKCGKCGKKALYVFPNQNSKCLECGHTFSLAPPPKTVMPPLEHPVTTSGPAQTSAAQAGEEPQRSGIFGRRKRSDEKKG